MVIVAVFGSCAMCSLCASLGNNGASSSNDNGGYSTQAPSKQPTVTPMAKPTATPRPTATPKPLSGYDLYSTWDKEKIQAEATAVDWNDFIRYPDNYKGKLIHLRGDIVFDNKDFRGRTYFTVNVNPTFFKNHQYSNSDDYTPQYVQFNYNTQGLIDGDEIEMYGVYSGEKTFTDYPEIDGVYCIHYTFK